MSFPKADAAVLLELRLGGVLRLRLHLHSYEVQRLVVKVLDRVRGFGVLVDNHGKFRRRRQRTGIEQNLSIWSIVDVFAGFRDIQNACPAMRMYGLFGMRCDSNVKNSYLVVLEDHAVILWGRSNSVLCSRPKTLGCLWHGLLGASGREGDARSRENQSD